MDSFGRGDNQKPKKNIKFHWIIKHIEVDLVRFRDWRTCVFEVWCILRYFGGDGINMYHLRKNRDNYFYDQTNYNQAVKLWPFRKEEHH